MSRDARTIKETREAVTALVLAFDAWTRINADGKRTLLELSSLFSLIPPAWEAIQGADQIMAEIKDLDGLETDELIAYVASKMNIRIETNEMRLKIDKILIAAHAIADANAQWFGINPPKAQIVTP